MKPSDSPEPTGSADSTNEEPSAPSLSSFDSEIIKPTEPSAIKITVEPAESTDAESSSEDESGSSETSPLPGEDAAKAEAADSPLSTTEEPVLSEENSTDGTEPNASPNLNQSVESTLDPPTPKTGVEAPAELDKPAEAEVSGSPVPSLVVPQRGSFSSAETAQSVPTPEATSVNPSEQVAQSSESVASAAPQPVVGEVSPTVVGAAPVVVSQPFVSESTEPAAVVKRSSKRKWFLVGGGVALLLALVAGYVFAWYLPNTPTNVYATGMERSGKALNALVTSATEQKQLEAYSTSVFKGSVLANVDGSTYSGDFTTTFDKTTTNGGLSVTLKEKGAASKKIDFKAMSKLPDNGVYPDVYFQVSGIKALGLDSYMPGVSAYDGKWISISADYLESLTRGYGVTEGDNTKDQPTAADVAEVARAATKVTQEYVFTADPEKAVFVRKEFVGKEKVDDLNTYHYKVGIDTDHATKYCVALSDAVLSTNAVKKLVTQSGGSDVAELKKEASKSCPDDVKNSVKSSDTYDMWVESKYKLIHKFRVYDKQDKQSYTDIGQTYIGGDKLSFFVTIHDEKEKVDAKFTLDTDVKGAKTSGTFVVTGKDKNSPYDVTVKLSAEATDKAPTFTKPTDAVPLQDVLHKLGLDSYLGSYDSMDTGSTSALKSSDVKAKSDINSLDAHIEAYYAETGGYPTLAQINSASWRATNMKGLDPTALSPSGAASAVMAAKPSSTQYAYVSTGCTKDGCEAFSVSAILSDGTTYQKTSDALVGSTT